MSELIDLIPVRGELALDMFGCTAEHMEITQQLYNQALLARYLLVPMMAGVTMETDGPALVEKLITPTFEMANLFTTTIGIDIVTRTTVRAQLLYVKTFKNAIEQWPSFENTPISVWVLGGIGRRSAVGDQRSTVVLDLLARGRGSWLLQSSRSAQWLQGNRHISLARNQGQPSRQCC